MIRFLLERIDGDVTPCASGPDFPPGLPVGASTARIPSAKTATSGEEVRHHQRMNVISKVSGRRIGNDAADVLDRSSISSRLD